VAFPFAWADGKIVYEGQGGMIRPGENQIPRSASDWQTVQQFAAVRSDAGQIVWGSPGVPLVQLGGLNCGKWQPRVNIDRPHLYSWPMNNYWYTNFMATQQGQFKWSYFLTSTPDPSNTAATRFAWSAQVPLVGRAFPPGSAREPVRPAASFLAADVPGLLLVEARPAWHGPGVVLHWREVEGRPASLNLAGQPCAASFPFIDEVNVLEERLKGGVKTLSFEPYETRFVLYRGEK
jgi:hypothetical protein